MQVVEGLLGDALDWQWIDYMVSAAAAAVVPSPLFTLTLV